jgi:Mg2+/Co2+ transporter CorC
MGVALINGLVWGGIMGGITWWLYDDMALGGVMMFQLGRVPSVADRFDWQGFRFEVMDMDKTRVDKILISHLPSSLLEKNDS